MIKFPCLCGVKFSLDDEMAGEMFQCKKCGRLVQVPTLDDLQHLNADGTYDLDIGADAPKRVSGHMASPDESSALADETAPDAYELNTPHQAPRYDPFTGELVRALDVAEVKESEVAKAGPRVQPLYTSKNRGKEAQAPPHAWLLLLGEMFMARNVAVLAILLAIYVAAIFLHYFVVGIGFFFFYPVPVFMLIICLSYYSLVIQETGPGEKDELPTPLRNFDIRSDVFEPFVHISVSAVMCFLPAGIVAFTHGYDPAYRVLLIALTAVGAFFFPAVFMTAAVDGVIANFRPDRVLGVIAKGGFSYIMAAITWTLGTIMLLDAGTGLYCFFNWMFSWHGFALPPPRYVFGVTPSLFILYGGLYFSYYSCWLLAMIWRAHHNDFPWIAQRFTSDKPAVVPPRVARAMQTAAKEAGQAPVPPRQST